MELSRRDLIAGVSANMLLECVPPKAVRAGHTVFGVNSYDIFLRALRSAERTGTDTLRTLGRMGIPFVRFAASAQWAGDWSAYEADPARYWACMDEVFVAAEHSGVKLVPSVLWHTVALSFHLGEPVRAWADPQSKTSLFAQHYTEDFVERYDRSGAILMYEFCNEMNDHIDDANLLKSWPKQDPTLPDRKPAAGDLMTSTDLRSTSQRFAQTIRAKSRRPIGMGSNVPRGYAWHMARGQRELDTREQFIEQLRAITPTEMNVLSIHLYYALWPWPKAPSTISDVLSAFVEAASLEKRISFLGEFNVKRREDQEEERKEFVNYLIKIKNNGVDYAAVWNVNLGHSQMDFDIIPGASRSYQLDAIVEANKQKMSWPPK